MTCSCTVRLTRNLDGDSNRACRRLREGRRRKKAGCVKLVWGAGGMGPHKANKLTRDNGNLHAPVLLAGYPLGLLHQQRSKAL